jgi:hypothetical protein
MSGNPAGDSPSSFADLVPGSAEDIKAAFGWLGSVLHARRELGRALGQAFYAERCESAVQEPCLSRVSNAAVSLAKVLSARGYSRAMAPCVVSHLAPFINEAIKGCAFIDYAVHSERLRNFDHVREAAAHILVTQNEFRDVGELLVLREAEMKGFPVSGRLKVVPGGFSYRGRTHNLVGRPLAMLVALLGSPLRRLGVDELRSAMGIDDEAVMWPDQVIRDTAAKLRKALKRAASEVGLATDHPLTRVGRGADLTYELRMV